MDNTNSFKPTPLGFDLKKEIGAFSKHWKWFVLSAMISVLSAFLYLRYETPQYNATGKIMLMITDDVSNPAEAVLKDMGQFSSNAIGEVEDEIQVLKSRELMKGVVNKLDLNKEFFVKGRIHDSQLFPVSKAPIKINFIESDSVIDKSKFNFSVRIASETSFNYIYNSRRTGETISENMFFGKNVTTPIGDIIVTPNTNNISKLIGKTIGIKIRSLDRVAEKYIREIEVYPSQKGSKIVDLSLNDPSRKRAEAIINTLIEEYNRIAIDEKNIKSNNTADFINNRIDLIATDLSKVDDDIEQFKTGNKLTDISSEASLYLASNDRTEQELAFNRTALNKINFMKNQIDDASFARIPSNIGLSDASVNLTATKYNELLDNRDRLLKSSNEKNPIIVNLDQQLNTLKNSLRASLDNSAKTVGLQIRSLENQAIKISSKIYAVPGQVRKSRDIEREQGIKESL